MLLPLRVEIHRNVTTAAPKKGDILLSVLVPCPNNSVCCGNQLVSVMLAVNFWKLCQTPWRVPGEEYNVDSFVCSHCRTVFSLTKQDWDSLSQWARQILEFAKVNEGRMPVSPGDWHNIP